MPQSQSHFRENIRESYPSPQTGDHNLPFYQQLQLQQAALGTEEHAQEQDQHSEQNRGLQQNNEQEQERGQYGHDTHELDHDRQREGREGLPSASPDARHARPSSPQYQATQEAEGRDAHHQTTSPSDEEEAHLNNMLGGLGSFGTLPAHTPSLSSPQPHSDPRPDQHALQYSSPSAVPHSSVAFAQASGSLDSTDKNREKRSKVSRACDECRRKKIRCDAIDETASSPCTNCARTGARCAFSRQPMKRGPSKGYIKELAERLNTLEQQVQPPHLQQQHRHEIQQVQQAMEGLQPHVHDPRLQDARAGDKRSHDVAESLHNGQRFTSIQHALPGQGAPAYLPPPPPLTGSTQPFWRYGAVHENRRDPVSLGLDLEINNGSNVTNFEWDESVLDEYYRIIHQTFPLLPNNRHRLRQRLADCPASLREAFLTALDCLMRTFPTATLVPNPIYAQALKRTAELLAQYPFDNPSSHTDATNLIYLQTLILMALESDNHGPATIRGQAGPSRAEWLGRAAGVAGQLEINVIRTTSQSLVEGDRDSEERLARRVWWVLFILDRWHASSTADLLKLPENSVVLLPEDQILLGESTYHLARLSFIIGHLAAILTTTKTPSTDVMAPSNPASSLLGLTLAGEIDRFRESVESVWGSLNLVHLSYHHCHLLIKRMNPTTEPSELVGHAVKVATMLNSRLTPVTPLNHHFGALAAMTLCELADVPKTRLEALRGLAQMAECLGTGRGLAGKLESEGWDGAVRDLVTAKREKMGRGSDGGGGGGGGGGLTSLANAAVAGDEARFDPTTITRYGYLTALGQGKFGRDGM